MSKNVTTGIQQETVFLRLEKLLNEIDGKNLSSKQKQMKEDEFTKYATNIFLQL